jgi:hypothetical protein
MFIAKQIRIHLIRPYGRIGLNTVHILELHDSYRFYQSAINQFKPLENYEILKFYLVLSSSSEIFQDTLSTL